MSRRDWPEGCIDQDLDGFPVCPHGVEFATDCDDDSFWVNPAASEHCNAIDDDCDGVIDEDMSYCGPDGTLIESAPGAPSEPDPRAAEVPERSPETARVSRRDWPEGCIDEDLDGFPVCPEGVEFATDCDDTDRAVNPVGTERCNLIDDDCDGAVDEEIVLCQDGSYVPGERAPDPPEER